MLKYHQIYFLQYKLVSKFTICPNTDQINLETTILKILSFDNKII